MVSVDELIERAKPRETTAAICMAGDLNAQHQDLARRLAELGEGTWVPDSLSAPNPRVELAEQVTDLERRMAEQVHVFRMRALAPTKFAELKRAHPPRDDAVVPERLFNLDTFAPALIAACCVDPQFEKVEQVTALFDRLSQGAIDEAFTAAWTACTGASDVPKSALASVLTRATAPS